jgi:hypothetical protein
MNLPSRIWQLGTCRIAHAISQLTAQKRRHDIEESLFWRRQIRVAWWLNAITLTAAIVAVATVIVLIGTLTDARKATVEANRAWVAPRTAFLRREFRLNDHLAFRITYDNVGRQPARNNNFFSGAYIVDAHSLIHSLSDPSLAESVFRENPTCSGHTTRKGADIIWPSNNGVYSLASLDDDRYPVITQRVIDGDDAVVVVGCFLYDTFEEVHHSMFCFLVSTSSAHRHADYYYTC